MPENHARKPQLIDAVLVMDSRGSLTPVRTRAFALAWSRLYHAGHYYLDLSLKPESKQAVLLGRLLPEMLNARLEGQVRLQAAAGGKPRLVRLEPPGEFRLLCDTPGQYELLIELQDAIVRVHGLDLR
jgi:hypothetical protein